jgi:hypothetical protein
MADLRNSPTINEYKKTMSECIRLYYPNIDPVELDMAINRSIKKRYDERPASIENSYTHKVARSTLLDIADYINSREPIVTAFGTMFRKHGEVPNPMAKVIQQFLDLRKDHKKQMFKYPKGSEMFEKYNLLQSLDKIDANGIYGGNFSTILIVAELFALLRRNSKFVTM